MPELINVLIRTSNRPEAFARCLKSVVSQTYENIRIIISIDRPVNYIPDGLEVIQVSADRSLPYFYDCYCNDLKALVTEGYYFWLDDDDILTPGVLSRLVLDAPALLVQLQRAENIVPQGLEFRRGQIGMPCIIVHHSLKHIADVPGTGQGDYYYIKEMQNKVGLKFVPEILVYSFGRGLGK